MRTIKDAQRVALFPLGGIYLRGTIDGRFSETSRIVEEIEENLFRTEDEQIFMVLNWFPPSKPTSEYETIPADWPTSKKAQENIA